MQGPDRSSESCISYSRTDIIQYISSIGTTSNGKYKKVKKGNEAPPVLAVVEGR